DLGATIGAAVDAAVDAGIHAGREVHAAHHRDARVRGARIAVVADQRRSGGARAGHADLGAVAGVGVGARGAVRDARMRAAARGRARVRRARVPVVAAQRRARAADTGETRLGAV